MDNKFTVVKVSSNFLLNYELEDANGVVQTYTDYELLGKLNIKEVSLDILNKMLPFSI